MISVVLIGTGNIAQHLFTVFQHKTEIVVTQVVGRNTKALSFFSTTTKTTENFDAILEADIYIIAVNDDAITTVSKKLRNKKGIITHTSGSVPLTALYNNGNRGVFYPLQTFTKDKKIDFKIIPICIEAEKEESKKILFNLASLISKSVTGISSTKRKELHLAAVFVNNFTNHLYHIGEEICNEASIPSTLLHPLIKETAEKAILVGAKKAQTGPAKRNDSKTINTHLELLKSKKNKDIYSMLSAAIKYTYGEKL